MDALCKQLSCLGFITELTSNKVIIVTSGGNKMQISASLNYGDKFMMGPIGSDWMPNDDTDNLSDGEVISGLESAGFLGSSIFCSNMP